MLMLVLLAIQRFVGTRVGKEDVQVLQVVNHEVCAWAL